MDITPNKYRRQFLKNSCFLLTGLSLYGCGSQSSDNKATTESNSDSFAPTITQEPADTTVKLGQTATFKVTTEGTEPLSFQWYRDNQIISGANKPTYNVIPTSVSENGSIFKVSITNKAGSVESRPAFLNIASGVTIDTTTLRIDNTLITIDEI